MEQEERIVAMLGQILASQDMMKAELRDRFDRLEMMQIKIQATLNELQEKLSAQKA